MHKYVNAIAKAVSAICVYDFGADYPALDNPWGPQL